MLKARCAYSTESSVCVHFMCISVRILENARDVPIVVLVPLKNCGGSAEQYNQQFKLDQKERRRVWKMELLRKDHASR